MQDLKIALVQMDVQWHAPEENRKTVKRELLKLPDDTDLVVLPEMFATGFSMSPKAVAEPMDGPTLKFLRELAVSREVAIAGSLAIETGGAYVNRFVFVHPSGAVDHYDKRHLFSLAGEDKVYTRGLEKKIIEYKFKLTL